MALELVKKRDSDQVVGGIKVQFHTLTFTGVTEGKLKTGLTTIWGASFLNRTTEADGQAVINTSDGSTSEPGSIYFQGFTSGDVVDVTVFGS